MRTDEPLKRLTEMCGADLLPLFGLPAAELIEVTSRELPTTATRLDTILRVRSPLGQEYLHILEWLGYPDPLVLWRLGGYKASVAQDNPTLPVVASVIYLHPRDDVGNTLRQVIDGQVVQEWTFGCVRLWEQDAVAALASGKVGLAVLLPLMHNATAALAEQAIDVVLTQSSRPQQDELLVILGLFAETFINNERFVRLVGKERLMESTLINYLIKDKVAETEAKVEAKYQAKLAELERESTLINYLIKDKVAETEAKVEAKYQALLAEQQAKLAEVEQAYQQRLAAEQQATEQQTRIELQQALIDIVTQRFPHTPLTLMKELQQLQQPAKIRELMLAVYQVPDLPAFEALLKQAAASSESTEH